MAGLMQKTIRRLMPCLLLLALPVFAGNRIETVTVSATADNEVAAISHALARAVQQVNGVDVTVVTDLQALQPQILINWRGDKIVLQGGDINRGQTVTAAAGPVRAYRVLDSRAADGRWQVRIEADIQHYEAWHQQNLHLPTLVVSRFNTEQARFASLAGDGDAASMADRLQQLLNQLFAAGGHFRLLDRQHLQQLQGERDYTAQMAAASEHGLRQQQALGADVLLAGRIYDAELSKTRERLYDSYNDLYHGEFVLDISAVEVATGEILWTESVRRQYTHQQLRTALQALMPETTDSRAREQAEKNLQQQVYQQLAADIAGSVLRHLYPVRVLQAGNNQVYLSQGLGVLAVGDRLAIHAPATVTDDAASGRRLALAGEVLATVEVQQVASQWALARVVSGDNTRITSGAPATPAMASHDNHSPDSGPLRPLTPGSADKPLVWP